MADEPTYQSVDGIDVEFDGSVLRCALRVPGPKSGVAQWTPWGSALCCIKETRGYNEPLREPRGMVP